MVHKRIVPASFTQGQANEFHKASLEEQAHNIAATMSRMVLDGVKVGMYTAGTRLSRTFVDAEHNSPRHRAVQRASELLRKEGYVSLVEWGAQNTYLIVYVP